MNKQIDVPIGSTIVLLGKNYECHESNGGCVICAFNHNPRLCRSVKCNWDRNDRKFVYFKEVSKAKNETLSQDNIDIKELKELLSGIKKQVAALEFIIRKLKNGKLVVENTKPLSGNEPLIKDMLDRFERMGINRDMFFVQSRKRGMVFFARCVFAERLRRDGYKFEEIAHVMKKNHTTVVYYVNSYNKAVNEPRFERDFVHFIEEFEKQMRIQ